MLLKCVPKRQIIAPMCWPRLYSSNNNSKGSNSSKKDGGKGTKSDQNSLSQKTNNDVQQFKVKSSSSSAAPAPLENKQVTDFMKTSTKPYIPKLKHERLSYDYPGLPNQDDFTKQSNEGKISPVKRYTRYIPHMLTAIFVLWGGYTVKVWFYPGEEGSDAKEVLDPDTFHKFIVTHKEQIDPDHYLIELMPKYNHWQYSFAMHYASKSVWNGDRIWSIEVKQPQIMVVRSYTPLPLYFMKSEYTRSGQRKPLLKVITPNGNDYDHGGVMTLYVKRYGDGEVSKFITDKEVGEEIEVRGPHVEYRFPYHPLNKLHERPVFKDLPSKVEPEIYLDKVKAVNRIPEFDNLSFFAAGTGIAPILQVLMSRNPYKGFTTVHYSARKPGEVEALERFMFFLEKLDRVKFINHFDSEKSFLTKKHIVSPQEPHYLSPQRKEEIQTLEGLSSAEALKLRQSILDGKPQEEQVVYDKEIIRYESGLQQAKASAKIPKENSSLALVCGPDGYVEYVAGPVDKIANEQGEVKGLLGQKGWDNSNTFKLPG